MGEPRALRADAERNRQAIVAAARTAFAEAGTEVSIAEIARRAGVGFATVQRRFPTKSALVAEVVAAQLADLGDPTGEAEGPWEAFAAPVRDCCAHQASEPGLADAFAQVLVAASGARGSDPTIREPVAALFDQLSGAAREAGDLRPDVTLDDVLLLVKANAGVVANSPGHEVDASRRFVDLALEGLRVDRTAPAQAQGSGRGGGGPT